MSIHDDLPRHLAQAYPDTPDDLRRLRERLAAAAQAEASSTSPTAPSTARSARCCSPRPTSAWSGWPTPREDHDTVLQTLSDRISPRILHAPARLDTAARELDEYFAGTRQRLRRAAGLAAVGRVPRHRAAPAARHRLRAHGQLRRRRRAGRQPEGGARGRHRLRDQPAAGRRPVPPRGALRRIAWAATWAGSRPSAPCSPWRTPHDQHPSIHRHSRSPGHGTTGSRPSTGTASAASSTRYGCALTGPAAHRGRGRRDRRALRRRSHGSAPPSTCAGTASARASTGTSPNRSRTPCVGAEAGAVPAAAADRARLVDPPGPATPRGPTRLDEWLDMCHAAGQTKSTPILLRYGPGDWNALHRDLYGELVFPLQVVINLNEPGADHTGGEFLVSSSDHAHSPAAPRRSSRRATGWCSPPATDRCARRAAGRPRPSGTGCR